MGDIITLYEKMKELEERIEILEDNQPDVEEYEEKTETPDLA